MNYYISDLHFGHINILKYDDRPFLDIETHDKALISNWNGKIQPDDDVYILGDISWYSPDKTIEIVKQLKGKKHLIVGNHDSKLVKNKSFRDLFVEVCEYKEIVDNKMNIVLSHYPIPCFKNHYHNGWYMLYGHVHNAWEWNMMEHIKKEMKELYLTSCNMYNVGCMMKYMNYTPQTLGNIIDKYIKWKNKIIF